MLKFSPVVEIRRGKLIWNLEYRPEGLQVQVHHVESPIIIGVFDPKVCKCTSWLTAFGVDAVPLEKLTFIEALVANEIRTQLSSGLEYIYVKYQADNEVRALVERPECKFELVVRSSCGHLPLMTWTNPYAT